MIIPQNEQLRLHIRYQKYFDIEAIRDACSILKSKGHTGKAEYISKAICHARSTEYCSNMEREVLATLRCMKFIKAYYEVSTKQSVEKMLSMGKKSATFKNAEKRMLKGETPRCAFYSFSPDDPEGIYAYTALMNMTASERVQAIAESIRLYVQDNCDTASTMKVAFSIVHDSIVEYQQSNDRRTVIEEFHRLLQQADHIT